MATGEIGEALKALNNSRKGLKTGARTEDWSKVRSFLTDLDRSIANLTKVLSQQPDATIAPPAPPAGAAEASRAPVPPEGTEMRISDFFESVGEGVVAAQERLDQRSKSYLATKPELALPALFRIPKASAEIHFAIEQTKTKKFSVLVYGASDTRQHQQQHKVSFDIISAPPPPEMLQQILIPKARDVFVTGPAERERIRERMIAYAHRVGEDSQVGKHALGLAEEDTFRQLLILRSDVFWVLMLPRARNEGGFALDVAYVYAEEGQDPQLYGKWPPVAKMDDRLNTLLALFLELSRDQEKHLSDA